MKVNRELFRYTCNPIRPSVTFSNRSFSREDAIRFCAQKSKENLKPSTNSDEDEKELREPAIMKMKISQEKKTRGGVRTNRHDFNN
jgi:hypothetical protein